MINIIKTSSTNSTTFPLCHDRSHNQSILDYSYVLSRYVKWSVLACILTSPIAASTAARADDVKTIPG